MRIGELRCLARKRVIELDDSQLCPMLIESPRDRPRLSSGQPPFSGGASERCARLHVCEANGRNHGGVGESLEELVTTGFVEERLDERARV